jgi:hypothetical protein
MSADQRNKIGALLLVFALCAPVLTLGGCSDFAAPPVMSHNPNDNGASANGGSDGGSGGMGY